MKKGFTLVELLAVIAILGILLTVSGTAVFAVLNSSQEKLLAEQIKGLEDAAISYAISDGKYLENCPADFDPANPSDEDCYMKVSIKELVDIQFFENKNDLCDINSNVIVYQVKSGNTSELKGYVQEGICMY